MPGRGCRRAGFRRCTPALCLTQLVCCCDQTPRMPPPRDLLHPHALHSSPAAPTAQPAPVACNSCIPHIFHLTHSLAAHHIPCASEEAPPQCTEGRQLARDDARDGRSLLRGLQGEAVWRLRRLQQGAGGGGPAKGALAGGAAGSHAEAVVPASCQVPHLGHRAGAPPSLRPVPTLLCHLESSMKPATNTQRLSFPPIRHQSCNVNGKTPALLQGYRHALDVRAADMSNTIQ